MAMTNEEKEALYEEFVERMKNEKVKPNSISYKNRHNLERARKHFEQRFDHALLIRKEGLNWEDWRRIIRLVCSVYGVRSCGYIPEDELSHANEFAIWIIDILFDENIGYLEKQ